MGFPPHKKGRQTFLKKVIASEYPAVVYESKHRIVKMLEELETINKQIGKTNECDDTENKITNYKLQITNKYQNSKFKKANKEKERKITSVVVCREISKMHETVYRGELKNTIAKIKDNKDDQKGEFVVIIGK
jgi:16S rRNA (cytidine1402-2'-O)-methyltransferase